MYKKNDIATVPWDHNNVAVIKFLVYNYLKYRGLPPPANNAYFVIFQCVVHTFFFTWQR